MTLSEGRRRAARAAIPLAAALLAAPIAAAAPAALIVDSRGAIIPPAPALTEAEEGATYTLDGVAELIVIHYASCLETHFRGGEVAIGPLGATGGAEIVGETEIECPRKVAFAEAPNASASVVLRGGEAKTVVNPKPFFVILGDGVATVEIRRGGALLGAMDVRGGVARWPAGLPPLDPGEGYEIAIAGGGVVRTAPAAIGSGAGVTIIQP